MRVLWTGVFSFHTRLPSTSKHATPTLPKYAQTCLPSVTGVSEASEFLMWIVEGILPWKALLLQSSLPVLASRQWTRQSCSPGGALPCRSAMYRPLRASGCLASLTLEVTKTRDPHTTGDDH